MSNMLRFALGAVFAIGLAGSAAAAELCPTLDRGGASAAVEEVSPDSEDFFDNARQLPGRGSWSAYVNGNNSIISDDFSDGSRVSLLRNGDNNGLLVWIPDWHLTEGQTIDVKIAVDDEIFSGIATAMGETGIALRVGQDFVDTFYNGRQGTISVGDRELDFNQLSDAAYTRSSVRSYQDYYGNAR